LAAVSCGLQIIKSLEHPQLYEEPKKMSFSTLQTGLIRNKYKYDEQKSKPLALSADLNGPTSNKEQRKNTLLNSR
jgi:ubiquitin